MNLLSDILRTVYKYLLKVDRTNIVFVDRRFQRLFPIQEKLFSPKYIKSSVKHNYLKVLKWAVTTSPEDLCLDSDQYYCIAAENGNLKVLKWLHEKMNAPWSENTRKKAIKYRFYKISDVLNEYEGRPWDYFIEAIKNGHLEVVKYLYTTGCDISAIACDEAFSRGHLEIAKWLLPIYRANNQDMFLDDWCNSATSGGSQNNLQIIKWVILEYIPTDSTYDSAAIMDLINELWSVSLSCGENGLNITKWLWSRELHSSIVLDDYDCVLGINNLNVLKWLRSIGAPLDKKTCLRKAKSDDIRGWISSQE